MMFGLDQVRYHDLGKQFVELLIKIQHRRDDVIRRRDPAVGIIAVKTVGNLDGPDDHIREFAHRDLRKVFDHLLPALGPLLGLHDTVLRHDLQNARGRVKGDVIQITYLLRGGDLPRRLVAHIFQGDERVFDLSIDFEHIFHKRSKKQEAKKILWAFNTRLTYFFFAS